MTKLNIKTILSAVCLAFFPSFFAVANSPSSLDEPLLVRGSDNQQKVFLIDKNGNKRAFLNTQIFERCGLDFSAIQTVHPVLLNCCAETQVINSVESCRETIEGVQNSGGIAFQPENNLLAELRKLNGGGTSNFRLPKIETLETIINRSKLEESLTSGEMQKLAKNSGLRVVRSSSQQQLVYLLDIDGKRRQFDNVEVFKNCALDFNSIETLADSVINAIPLGKPLKQVDQCKSIIASISSQQLVNALLNDAQNNSESFVLVKQPLLIRNKESQQRVYLVDINGQRREFLNADLFTNCGLNYSAIQTVDNALLQSRTTGSKINSVADCKQILVELESFVIKDKLLARQPKKPPEYSVGLPPRLSLPKPLLPKPLLPGSLQPGTPISPITPITPENPLNPPTEPNVPIVEENLEEVAEAITLASIVPDLALPENLATAIVTPITGGVGARYFEGAIKLNGLNTKVISYIPLESTQANLILALETAKLVDFMPDINDMQLADYGEFKQPMFFFVSAENVSKLPNETDLKAIQSFVGRDDIADISPIAGIQFVASVDLTQHPEGKVLASVMGMKSASIVVDLPLDERFFANVKPSNDPALPLFPDNSRTLANLEEVYGKTFFQQAKFRAQADYLVDKRIGPAKITSAQWELAFVGKDDEAVEQSIALNTDLDIPLIVADTKFSAKEVQLKYDQTNKLITLNGSVERAQANTLVSLPGLDLTTAVFSGEYSVPEDLSKKVGEAGGKLEINGLANLDSLKTKKSNVNYELALQLAESGNAVDPLLTLTGGYSLADILQGVTTNIPDVELNRIQVSANHLAGTVSLYGLPVQAVYYKTADMSLPIVGLHHQEVDLVSYIPKIKETNLGSFGLANVLMFARPEQATTDITYANREEVPQPLAELLSREGVVDEDLFPLVLKPGINLIGQYGRGLVSDEGHASLVMDAYGIEQAEQPAQPNQPSAAAKVYIVKANFKASNLKNVNYQRYLDDGKQAVRSVTAKQVACSVITEADRVDKSGLDLRIKLPNFSPPYASKAVNFSNSFFSLKEINNQIEPSIVSVMGLNLPEAQAGIKQLALGTKLSVKGELNQLCEPISSESEYEVSFAGSTAINLENIADLAFEALAKVTQLDASKSLDKSSESADNSESNSESNTEKGAENTASVAQQNTSESTIDAVALAQVKQKSDNQQNIGWQKPLGIEFLTIKRFASAGTFAQSEGKYLMQNSLWTESQLGTETIDVLGSLMLESNMEDKEFTIEDWLFRVASPVKLIGLPGMQQLADVYPMIELGDLTVNYLDLTSEIMTGKLSSASRSIEGDFALYLGENELQQTDIKFYAGVNRFNTNMLLKKPLPGLVGDLTLGRTAFSIQTGKAEPVKLTDLPDAAQKIFTATVGKQLQADVLIPQERGITIAGRLNPVEIPNRTELNSLKSMFNLVGMQQPIAVVGSLVKANENSQTGTQTNAENTDLRSTLSAFVPQFNLPLIPKEQLVFTNNQLNLSSLDGNKVQLKSTMQFSPAASLQGTLGTSLSIDGELEYQAENANSYELIARGNSTKEWQKPLGINGLSFTNIGIEVADKNIDGKQTSSLSLISDATLFSQALKARYEIQQSSSSSTTTSSGQLIELQATEENELIDLQSILTSLTLMPANADYLDISQYFNLKAKGLLLAQDASNAQITFAAEDVTGEINVPRALTQAEIDQNYEARNALNFSGQLAITGFNGVKPSLFLKNDNAITLDDIIPADVGVGPLATLGIPNGLVMFSADNGNLSLSAINQRIYDKVFADLLGEQGAASVILMRNGLTILVRSNFKDILPGEFGNILSWLPSSGEVILGGGVEKRGTVSNLGFYANIRNLSLEIPTPFDTFVNSAGGNVYFYAKTIGEKGAGAEVGLQTGLKMNVPRLDNPTSLQPVNAALKLAATVIPGASPNLTVGVKVPNKWDNPLGIEDISLTNTEVDIGVAGNGTVFSLHTEQARFKDKTFVMDLDSAWAGAVPTQLAVQFAKDPTHTGNFDVTPVLQAQLYNSLFKVATRGGSALADSIRQQLDSEILMLDTGVINSKALFNQFSNVLAGSAATSDVMLDVLENSPLAWIGIRNPEIFFVTPGNNLPPREGIKRPPLGLGLLAKGELILDIGSLDIAIADGEYKINLVDGYYAKGNINPPKPFSDTNFSVLGKQSIITMTPSALRVDGSFKLPGSFIPGVPAAARGSFAFSRKEGVSNGVHIDADLEIADYGISRAASIDLVDNTFNIDSVPNGCVDVPIKFDGNITASLPPSANDAKKLLSIAEFTAPSIDPISCTEDLVNLWANYAKEWIDNPTKALENPEAVKQAMFDASKTALSMVPDNPATRELYKGIEAIEGVLPPLPSIPGAGKAGELVNKGLGEVTDLAKKIPGAGEASKLAGEAAKEVKKRVSQAISNVAGEASKAATAAADVAMQGVKLGSKAVSDIKNAVFGSGKNWCNARIEVLRTQNLEINKAKALEMEKALTSMWTVGKESEAILPFLEQAKTKVTSTQETFINFSTEWNELVQDIFAPGVQKEYYATPVFSYHNAGKGWRSDRADDEQDSWYFNRTIPSILRNSVSRSVTKRLFDKNLGDWLAQHKAWHEKSSFDPDDDYPGFRCEKTYAMQNFFFAGINMYLFHRPNDIVVTDTLRKHEYENIITGARDLSASYKETNQTALRYIENYQVLAAERNIAFIADLRVKMQGAIDAVKVKYLDDTAKYADLTPAFNQAETAVKNFYQFALELSEKGSDSYKNQRIVGLFTTANKKISDLYLAEANLDLAAVNQPWNSTEQLPVIAFPYVDKCLTSFYRPLQNDNPLKVMQCHPELAKALEDIENGQAESIKKGTTVLQQAWKNATTGSVRVVEDRRYQFKLWEAEYGAYRMSTAASEQSPVADYCLGVPKLFTNAKHNIPLQVQPCLENDFGQLWTKVSDEGGPAFFKLQSVEYGLCATWSGVSGVDSLVLKSCSANNNDKQVMSTLWPLRDSIRPQPKILPADIERKFVWKSSSNGRCFNVHAPNANGLEVTAYQSTDWKCNQIKPNGSALESFTFSMENDSDNKWRFVTEIEGSKSCLISKNQYVSQFGFPEISQNKYSKRTIGLGSCESFKSLWEILPSGSDYEATLADKKYKIREAYGEKQCMNVSQTTSYPYLVKLPVTLNNCSNSFRYPNELFRAIEVDSDFSNNNNLQVKQWYQGELNKMGSIQGGIFILDIDGVTELPASGIQVTLSKEGSKNIIAQAISNQEGLFNFDSVPQGNYWIHQKLPSHINVSSDSHNEADNKVYASVAANTVSQGHEFVNREGVSLSGTVVIKDAENFTFIENKTVKLLNRKTNEVLRETTTNDKGYYKFEFVKAGQYEIVIDPEEYAVYKEGYYKTPRPSYVRLDSLDGRHPQNTSDRNIYDRDFVLQSKP